MLANNFQSDLDEAIEKAEESIESIKLEAPNILVIKEVKKFNQEMASLRLLIADLKLSVSDLEESINKPGEQSDQLLLREKAIHIAELQTKILNQRTICRSLHESIFPNTQVSPEPMNTTAIADALGTDFTPQQDLVQGAQQQPSKQTQLSEAKNAQNGLSIGQSSSGASVSQPAIEVDQVATMNSSKKK